MTTESTIEPYESDLDYLDDESKYFRAKAIRINVQQRLDDLSGIESQLDNMRTVGEARKVKEDNLSLLLAKALGEENQIRESINERLSVTRAQYGQTYLGVQKLERRHDLNGEERLVITLLAIAGVSPRIMNQINEPLNMFGSLAVEEILGLVCEPTTLENWAYARETVQKLTKDGLITLDYMNPKAWPESVMSATPRLTKASYTCIIGLDEDCGDGEQLVH